MMPVKIKAIDHHRNGSSGESFYAAIATDGGQPMLIVRFEDDEMSAVRCAVFNISLLAEGLISQQDNGWRGDEYAGVMDKAIKDYGKEIDRKLAAILAKQK